MTPKRLNSNLALVLRGCLTLGAAVIAALASGQARLPNRIIAVGPPKVIDEISNFEFEYPPSEEASTVARLNAKGDYVVVVAEKSGPQQEDLTILIHRSTAGIGEMQDWAQAFDKLGPDNRYLAPSDMGPVLRGLYEDTVRRMPVEMRGPHLASGGGIDLWSGIKVNVLVDGQPRSAAVSFGAKAKGISERTKKLIDAPDPFELEPIHDEQPFQARRVPQVTIRMGNRGLDSGLHASAVVEAAKALQQMVQAASTDYLTSFAKLSDRLAAADPKMQEFLNGTTLSMNSLPNAMRHELRTLLGYPEGGIRITRLQPAALFVIGGQVGPNTFSHFILPMPGG